MTVRNFKNETDKIYGQFLSEKSNEWLKKTGREQEAYYYLNQMAKSKTNREFETAKLDFKKNIVQKYYDEVIVPGGKGLKEYFLKKTPIMSFAGPKELGSYDDFKKNESVLKSKYVTTSTNDKDEKVTNVPLLQIVNDPGELTRIAGELDEDEEDLRDHILNEWKKKKDKEWKDEEKAMRNAIVNGGKIGNMTFGGRKGVLKEYDKAFWSGVLRTVAPELYAGMRRDIAEGKGEAGSVLGWLGEHKKDAAIDAARNTALAMTGIAASPLATAGLVGATELSSLAASDYYDMNTRNVAAALTGATFAGTVPSLVTRYAAPLLKSGNKIIRSSARDILRRIRNGEGTAAEVEQNALYELVDEASKVVRARMNGHPNIRLSDYQNAVNSVYDKVSKAPNTILNGRISVQDVEKALMSNEGVKDLKDILTAPSKKTYASWKAKSESHDISYDEQMAYQEALDNADNVLFPNTVKEIKYISGNGKTLNSVIATGARVVNALGSKAEPMVARNVYEEGLSSYEKSNPEQVEQWKRYGIPDWDPLAEEFKEKYGEPDTTSARK